MRLIAVALLSVLPLVVSAQTKTKSPERPAEKEIIGVIDGLINAGIKRDVATIDRLYTADFIHTNPNGSIMTKEQVLAIYKSAPTAVIESSVHDEDVVRIYGNSAVVTNRAIIKGKTGDKPFESKYRITYFLNKQHGKWLIAASHASIVMQ